MADARQVELGAAPEPTIFLDNIQAPMYFAHLVVRTRNEPRRIARAVEAAIHRVDADQALSGIETMQDVFSDSVSRPRFQLVRLLVFAAIAVTLAATGVYGVVSYSVTQRTQEIAIRVALGARAADVSRLVLREGLMLAGAGVAAGLAGAVALGRVIRSLLFEVTPSDPLTLTAVAGLLLGIATAATLLPARRAAGVDPIVALRYE
ncbi:MAG TPA: FtsX-like permease family protein [Bryobacteraceae bacterium]|nr:FtsX-like permease family protein [Bryobacteraceae bacterium]